ncbi:OmpW family outer membrane protein [Caulobacter segnis]|uniref:OmpW family outer membrane protein n=1 Tax=Caulobacter segnis TaxID=88688 RepID=UPI001CBEA813|nr:OmpW family outer membrane protein [Caulobacter segnis]UAL09164.1 outer membrane beta-barrel protein [Caulobacter segnis]
MKSLLISAAATTLLFAGAAQAQDFKPNAKGDLIVHVRVTQVAPAKDASIVTAAGVASGLKAHVENDVKPTLGFTYFLTDKVAVEAILGTTQHDIRAQGPGTDVLVHKTWVLPPVVTLQYHPLPNARVSPYVGAGLNYMLFYSDKNKNGFTVKVDDGVGYAIQAGVNIKLKNSWLINADVKKVYFDTDAKINGGALKAKVNLDPLVSSIGISRQF